MNPDDFKKFNIGSIVRATQSSAALKHQLGFLIKVLEELDIQFSDCEQDPLRLAKAMLPGKFLLNAARRRLHSGGQKSMSKGQYEGSRIGRY